MRLILLLAICPVLFSNPTGCCWISGEGRLDNTKKSLLEIQVSDQATLEWEDFSIAAEECTRFIQPSSSSTVINRITGVSISKIDGLLESNGNLFLLNPSGVLIGKNAQIHSESFFACAYSLTDQSFSNRRLGKIVNQGNISAKSEIRLIGDVLENFGGISASHISLDGGEISNLGTICAFESGSILLSSRGNLECFGAASASRGSITLLADFCNVHPSSTITAEGGEIILKAEKFCNQLGTLFAEGGFIEISAKDGFHLGGSIHPGSLAKPGKLLLDPTDIDLGIGMTTPPSFTYPPAQMTFDRPGSPAFLNIPDLLSQLENGVSVTIQTTPGLGGMGRIRILSPVVWSQETSLTFIADGQIHVFADLMNTGSGSLFLTAGDDLFIQSTPSATAQLAAAYGNIQIQANNLIVESGGSPAEISANEGAINIGLTGSLTIQGGTGLETDARAGISAKNLSVNTAGSVSLLGGAAQRNSAVIRSISPQGVINLQIGNLLTLTGGSAQEASALLIGGASLLADISQGASLICGIGAEAAIKAPHGLIQIDVGTVMASDLTLIGNSSSGPASILGTGGVSLSSSQNISCSAALLLSQNTLAISAAGQAFFSQDSLAAASQSLQISGGSILCDHSKFLGQTALNSTGLIVFQNSSEMISPISLAIQGASFLFNQSTLKGVGTHTFQISGAVDFINSTLFDFPAFSCNAASFTIDQSTLYLSQFFPSISGNFTAQNSSEIQIDTFLNVSCNNFILDNSSVVSGGMTLAVSTATSLTNATLSSIGSGVLTGGSLTLNGSAVESTQSTLSLAFTGNATLIQSSISSQSDATATFNLLTMNQSSLNSLTASQTLTLSAASFLSNGSELLAGRDLTVLGTQLNLSASSLTGLNMNLTLSNSLSLAMNSQGTVPISCQIDTGTLCSFILSAFKSGQITITSPTLQLVDSTVSAEQSFQIRSATTSLMNSLIADPTSFLQN